jgi:predicted nucleic acid-binding protein
MVMDTQVINAMLIWLGVSVGAVVVIALAFVASAAAWQRYDRKQHISAVERYLALAARQHRPTHTS